MTSDRPYRASEMTLDMAIEELRRCSGTQFDPTVVDTIVACAHRGELALVPKTGAHPVVARV
jgi:HD-GYP domain-containing protein (c-di-GMP phosphodiesterase class II)